MGTLLPEVVDSSLGSFRELENELARHRHPNIVNIRWSVPPMSLFNLVTVLNKNKHLI
ncbi:hypothetical protein LINPERHAP1_LOCUS26285 [Linum perenne]